MNLIKAILLLITVFALTACGSVQYAGKVIPGQIGRPITIDASDDRINNQPGIPDLQVTLYNEAKSGQPPKQLDQTTTDADGRFAFTLKPTHTPNGAVTVRVTGDNIYSARSKTYLPREGQFMLFTVVSREPTLDEPSMNPEK